MMLCLHLLEHGCLTWTEHGEKHATYCDLVRAVVGRRPIPRYSVLGQDTEFQVLPVGQVRTLERD